MSKETSPIVSSPLSRPAQTPSPSSEADVSPMTQDPVPETATSYFPPTGGTADKRTPTTEASSSGSSGPVNGANGLPIARGRKGSILDRSSSSSERLSRKSSTASVSFLPPANPLPQGHPRPSRMHRSPSPKRFRQHVAFDNIPIGEPTKSNTLSYTLSISHHGYHPRRRSRTMMVGLDENAYSDVALQWLLEEYADDGDEVICVHVTDKDPRAVEEKNYKAHAKSLVERIKSKIPENCAISIKLEYAVGKLHVTFQKLIQVYEPSMLVVGTRGRSLGGIHGLVTKNSFSKYCLQYSPIPTVVVRDYEKRKKKKEKRYNDPTRHNYASMLAITNGVHEADSEASSLYDTEARISPDEEAHRVAAAIGLPAAFDPTLKPIDLGQFMGRRSRPSTPPPTAPNDTKEDVLTVASPATAVDSDEDESPDDDEAELEVMAGKSMLQETQAAKESEKQQKKRLHDMEVDEAAALTSKQAVDSDDDDDDDDDDTGGGAVTA